MRDFFEKYDHRMIWEPNSGCLIWMGAQTTAGYGHGHRDGVHFYAHRAAFECEKGPLGGLSCCHRCDFPPCCNPEHLFKGTHDENMKDMYAKGRRIAARGERASRSKLTLFQVIEIRRLYDAGITIAAIRRQLELESMKWDSVAKVARRRTWVMSDSGTVR